MFKRGVELAQARAEAAVAHLRATEAQRANAMLREMAAQGLKPAEWQPKVMETGALTFEKIEQKRAGK